MKKITVYKHTKKEWYPVYKLDNEQLVQVNFGPLSNGRWRVSCWGSDDYGIERDFDEEILAYDMFLTIVSMEYVSDEELLTQHGFINA